MNLREKVEELLPNWQRWYPSLFDAADDLGVIRATVCDPSSLLLSNRHAGIRQSAAEAHRENWGGQIQEEGPVRIRRHPRKKKYRSAANER